MFRVGIIHKEGIVCNNLQISILNQNLQIFGVRIVYSIPKFTNGWSRPKFCTVQAEFTMVVVNIVPTYQDLQIVVLSCLCCCILSPIENYSSSSHLL